MKINESMGQTDKGDRMNSEQATGSDAASKQNLVWIISENESPETDLSGIEGIDHTGSAKVYLISDIARYLLDPNPVQVKKQLIGCELHHPKPLMTKIKQAVGRFFSFKSHGSEEDPEDQPEVLVSGTKEQPPVLNDKDLEDHFHKIDELLLPYDGTIKRLLNVDERSVSTIMGICEDMDGNRSLLNLQGDMTEKTNFVINNISKDVGVVLKTAQIADGLFDMGGFDFKSYDPDKRYPLIRFLQNGETKCCVLNAKNDIDHWIDDFKLIQLLHLFEQSIRTNVKLRESFHQCIEGDARPLKLFFNQELEIEYSSTHPPEVYRQVFEDRQMAVTEKNVVLNSLKNLQLGISLNYVLKSNSGKERLCTSMSVLHDIRALDPIREIVPDVYTEIDKRTQASEAGRFYLLDSIRGYRNEQ